MTSLNALLKSVVLFIAGNVLAVAANAQATSANKGGKDTIAGCGCLAIKYAERQPRFFNALSHFLKENEVADISGWQLTGIPFKYLFEAGLPNTPDFNIIANRAPLRVIHPDKTFTLNLTPCKNEQQDYVLELGIYYQHKILNEVRDFDYLKFDHTPLAYVHLILQIIDKRPDQMMRLAFMERARRGPVEMNKWIAGLNRQYKTGVPLVTEKNYADSTVINGIMDSLVSKKLRQETVLTSVFISPDMNTHRITEKEGQDLYTLFEYEYPYISSLDEFEHKMIRPRITVYLQNKAAEMEISEAVIKPVTSPGPAKVYATLKSAEYELDEGLKMDFSSVCLQPSVIAGTNIGINFIGARLIGDRSQGKDQLNYAWYPMLAAGVKNKKPGAPAARYDSLLTNFTGLFVKQTILNFADGKNKICLTASNLIVNNFLMAGYIALNIAPGKPGAVMLNQGNKNPQKMSVPKLLALLKTAGLSNLITEIMDNQLYIYFRK